MTSPHHHHGDLGDCYCSRADIDQGGASMTHDKAEQPAQSESELLPDSEDDFEQPEIDVEQGDVFTEPPASDDHVQDDGTDVELDDDTSHHAERDTR